MEEYTIRFTDYISMLGQNCLFQLGKIADPLSGNINKDLRTAKITIDIISMLKEKTVGNLTNEENAYLQNTLSSLRLTYVDEINKVGTETNKTDPSNENIGNPQTDNNNNDNKE